MPQRWTMFFAMAVLVVATAGVGSAQQESIEETRAKAEAGDAIAQASLGYAYANGRTVAKDDTKAARWYRLAAEQGYTAAQVNLGVMYTNGRGVPQDYAAAAGLYRLAAEQGNPMARYLLGTCYRQGRGVRQDDAEALRWFRLAAEQGLPKAMFNLGLMSGLGAGTSEDDVQAYMWFNLAASRLTGTYRDSTEPTRETIIETRDFVYDSLTPDQRAEAQRLAREWDEAHPR